MPGQQFHSRSLALEHHLTPLHWVKAQDLPTDDRVLFKLEADIGQTGSHAVVRVFKKAGDTRQVTCWRVVV